MAFKINLSNTYKCPVSVEVPNEKGRVDKLNFDVEFHRFSRSQLQELSEDLGKGLKDEEMILRIAKSWSGVLDEDGKELELDKNNLALVSDAIVQFAPAIIRAFFDSVDTSRTKN